MKKRTSVGKSFRPECRVCAPSSCLIESNLLGQAWNTYLVGSCASSLVSRPKARLPQLSASLRCPCQPLHNSVRKFSAPKLRNEAWEESKGCLIKGCMNPTKIPKVGIPKTGIPKTGIPKVGKTPHWDSPRHRDSKARDSEVRDSENRNSENRDSEATLRAQRLKKFKILKFSSEIENFKRAAHQNPIFNRD